MTVLKHAALLMCTALASSTLFAQPAVKIYAFEQAVLPGTIPAGVTDENGNSLNTSKAGHSTDYFIYLSHSGKSIVTPVAIWIKGKCYSFKAEVIKSTPVIRVNYNMPDRPSTTLLVPKTTNKVTRLLVSGPIERTCAPTATEKKRLDPLNVVVSYKWKGQTYYATIATLKSLAPVMHQ